ncbi:hypothetical protein [Methylocystis sp. S23]
MADTKARQGDASQAVAAALRRGPLTTEQLARRVGKPRKAVAETVGRLIIGGYVERSERGVYSLSEEGKRKIESGERFRPGPRGPLANPQAPKTGRLRQRAWNAMRIKKRFTVEDLVTLASRGGEKLPHNNLQRYLRALAAAGYVTKRASRSMEGQSPASNGLIVYRLEKNSGEVAPSVAHDGRSIFDHNTKERVTW